jgi:hypothetical protein
MLIGECRHNFRLNAIGTELAIGTGYFKTETIAF